MKTAKIVFCAHCHEEIEEERAVYVRSSGKFYCNLTHAKRHHNQHTGAFVIPRYLLGQKGELW